MTTIKPIGYVRNGATCTDKPGRIKLQTSQIEIFEEYVKGLINILEHEYITVVFGLHQTDEIHLSESRNNNSEWGIFACRSQYRPNHLGVTNCRLLRRKGNIITVDGLDACNGSPVYDLKCPDTSEYVIRQAHSNILQKNPRHDIEYDLRNSTFYPLVLKSAQLTGKLSNELKLGVLSAMHLNAYIKANQSQYQSNNFRLTAHCPNDMMKGALFASGAILDTYQNRVDNCPTLRYEDQNKAYCYELASEIDIENDIDIMNVKRYWKLTISTKQEE